MKEFDLKLTAQEIDLILISLSEKSYKKVAKLIAKIKQQAEPQLQKQKESK